MGGATTLSCKELALHVSHATLVSLTLFALSMPPHHQVGYVPETNHLQLAFIDQVDRDCATISQDSLAWSCNRSRKAQNCWIA